MVVLQGAVAIPDFGFVAKNKKIVTVMNYHHHRYHTMKLLTIFRALNFSGGGRAAFWGQ